MSIEKKYPRLARFAPFSDYEKNIIPTWGANVGDKLNFLSRNRGDPGIKILQDHSILDPYYPFSTYEISIIPTWPGDEREKLRWIAVNRGLKSIEAANQKIVRVKSSGGGFFNKFIRAVTQPIEQVVTHPVAAIKHVGNVLKKAEKKAEKDIVTAATTIEKTGTKVLAVTGKVTKFVEKNAKTIKLVVDVTADVLDVVAVATGQPELVAGVEALRAGADEALVLAAKAQQIQDAAEKVLLVAKAIAEKKKLAEILKKAGDAMVESGKVSGNDSVVEMGKHIQKGSMIVKKVADHSTELHKIGKEAIRVVKTKDVKGAVKLGKRGFKEGKKIVATQNEVRKFYKDVKTGKKTKKTIKESKTLLKKIKKSKKARKTTKKSDKDIIKQLKKEERELVKELKKENKQLGKTTKTKTKGKRAPSSYNMFVGKHIKAGGSFTSAVQAWNKQKSGHKKSGHN